MPNGVAFEAWTNYEQVAKWSKKETAKDKNEDDSDDSGDSGESDDKSEISFTSKIGPSQRTWDTEIVEQVPGKRIVWRSESGPQNMGVISFHKLDDRLTRVMVEMEYHPSGFLEVVGNFFRFQRRRVRKDLRLFKNFIELKGESEGGGSNHRVRGHGLKDEMDDRVSSGSSGQDGKENG